jgi:hypothetical protein
MKAHTGSKVNTKQCYVVGSREFAAISAIEGLALHAEGIERRERTCSLSPAKRRAATIYAFQQLRKRG